MSVTLSPDAGAAARADEQAAWAARHPREAAYDAGLDRMTELLREDARAWARKVRTMVELDDLSVLGARAGTPQFPQLEMAGSWNVSQLTASRWMWEAERLTVALPRTLALLETGELLEHQGKVLLHRTRHCTVEVAQAVEAEVLPAGTDLCPADLGRTVDRAVLRIESEQADAAAAEQRHADAAAERRTFAKPLTDGMGLAGAVLTAEQLVAWHSGLDELERRERLADRQAGIERTAEQRRADLFAALPAMALAGTAQDLAADSAGRPRQPWTLGPEQLAAQVVLNVHVPVSTVLDLSREPGSLDGYGPLSAEHVRLLRPKSYRRIMVDAQTGRPIALDDRPTPADPDPQAARAQIEAMLAPAVVTDADEHRHDPSARLARLVDVRDVRCTGPGCSSTRCDRDHLEPWPTGPTSARNLGLLSRRCHNAKHAGWRLRRHPDGSSTWTSPLGRTYRRPPPHAPAPQVDLWQQLPPLRERPIPTRPDNGDAAGTPATGTPDASTPDASTPDIRGPGAGNDEPPPF